MPQPQRGSFSLDRGDKQHTAAISLDALLSIQYFVQKSLELLFCGQWLENYLGGLCDRGGIVALLGTGKHNFPLLFPCNDTVGCLFSKTVD